MNLRAIVLTDSFVYFFAFVANVVCSFDDC